MFVFQGTREKILEKRGRKRKEGRRRRERRRRIVTKTRNGVKTKTKIERRRRTMKRIETKTRKRNKTKTRSGKKTDPKRPMRNGRRIRSPEHHPEVTMHQEDLVVPAGLCVRACGCLCVEVTGQPWVWFIGQDSVG